MLRTDFNFAMILSLTFTEMKGSQHSKIRNKSMIYTTCIHTHTIEKVLINTGIKSIGHFTKSFRNINVHKKILTDNIL